MVSKASDDFPEPERPVITVSESRGISTSTFLRLCSRAPRMEMFFSMLFLTEFPACCACDTPASVAPATADRIPTPFRLCRTKQELLISEDRSFVYLLTLPNRRYRPCDLRDIGIRALTFISTHRADANDQTVRAGQPVLSPRH